MELWFVSKRQTNPVIMASFTSKNRKAVSKSVVMGRISACINAMTEIWLMVMDARRLVRFNKILTARQSMALSHACMLVL
jgi:hypothetical protein